MGGEPFKLPKNGQLAFLRFLVIEGEAAPYTWGPSRLFLVNDLYISRCVMETFRME